MLVIAFCTLWSLADATIFIAEVIFSVPFMEFILLFISFSDAMMLMLYIGRQRIQPLLL